MSSWEELKDVLMLLGLGWLLITSLLGHLVMAGLFVIFLG